MSHHPGLAETSTGRIFTEIHEFDPVDTKFIAGRWHRDRATWRGFFVEAKVGAKSLVASKNAKVKKFLIISRARSGSTLLRSLLNSHKFVYCDGEVLKRNVLFPMGYLKRLANKSNNAAYGAKILSYQLVQVQRIKEPRCLFENLKKQGFCFIHLKRNTFYQTVSLTLAQRSGVYHERRCLSKTRNLVFLDPQDFAKRIAWNDALLRYEEEIFRNIPHMILQYERDLLNVCEQQRSIDRISDWLDISRCPARSDLKKILPCDPKAFIGNYDEVAAAIRESGFGHTLMRF